MSRVVKYIPHYTVADYQQWQGDWELIDGVAVSMGPSPFGVHGALLSRLAYEWEAALRKQSIRDKTLLIEVDWIVDANTVVRPDIQLVQGAAPQRHVMGPPLLIAEILSASTQEMDRAWKFQLYQQQSVPFYLIADPENHQLDIYRFDQGSYQRLDAPTTTASTFDFANGCLVNVDLTTIFAN